MGPKDKKFCSSKCKNAHNYQLNKAKLRLSRRLAYNMARALGFSGKRARSFSSLKAVWKRTEL